MAGFTCPFCGMIMAVNNETLQTRYPSFENSCGYWPLSGGGASYNDSTIELNYFKCPNCGEYTLTAIGIGKGVKDINTIVKPKSFARQYPDYIPLQIRSDYEEASAVLYLSPKSSATLARRCLQGMIHDFWGIAKGRLYDEISELKDKIPSDLWVAIDSLRQLGNIGAHMEKDTNLIVDIDPNEAEQIIKLIELLMKEWYINREERRKLFDGIFQTNKDKQSQRKTD